MLLPSTENRFRIVLGVEQVGLDLMFQYKDCYLANTVVRICITDQIEDCHAILRTDDVVVTTPRDKSFSCRLEFQATDLHLDLDRIGNFGTILWECKAPVKMVQVACLNIAIQYNPVEVPRIRFLDATRAVPVPGDAMFLSSAVSLLRGPEGASGEEESRGPTRHRRHRLFPAL